MKEEYNIPDADNCYGIYVFKRKQELIKRAREIVKGHTFCSSKKLARLLKLPKNQTSHNICGHILRLLGWKKWAANGGKIRTWYDPKKHQQESVEE